MTKISAGLLMFRERDGRLEVLLAHPGGPLWANKDEGIWSIPKGQLSEGEDALVAACREFREETGLSPQSRFIPLKSIQQKSGKIVHAWAVRGDCDPSRLKSNLFTMEWPPCSGRQAEFPEIDRSDFFSIPDARRKINPGQVPLLEELESLWKAGLP